MQHFKAFDEIVYYDVDLYNIGFVRVISMQLNWRKIRTFPSAFNMK